MPNITLSAEAHLDHVSFKVVIAIVGRIMKHDSERVAIELVLVYEQH